MTEHLAEKEYSTTCVLLPCHVSACPDTYSPSISHLLLSHCCLKQANRQNAYANTNAADDTADKGPEMAPDMVDDAKSDNADSKLDALKLSMKPKKKTQIVESAETKKCTPATLLEVEGAEKRVQAWSMASSEAIP